MDTDCDPDLVDIPIPGNDDARPSIRWILDKSTSAICEGRSNSKFSEVNELSAGGRSITCNEIAKDFHPD